MDQTSWEAGVPKIKFVREGLGHGPVTITMPDGEILKGEYQVTQNAAVGFGFSGSYTATAIGYGASPVVLSATDAQGTIFNCQGSVDIDGNGSGTCQDNHGNTYRVMY
ncbi:MAG: hypothetical protein ACRECV_18200 [Xanthobacteraceae bacterium]